MRWKKDDEEFKYKKRLKRGGLEEVTAAVGPSVSGCIANGYDLQTELRLTVQLLKTREPKAEEKSTHTIIFLPRPSTVIAPL